MQRLVLGRLAVDLLEELEPFGVGVALLALADDLAIEDIQRRKQRGRAMALVVVRHRLRPAFLERQSGLGAIERLHLALLIATQYQGMFGRGQVQPHDVFELLDELRVARDLEAAHQVGLQAVGLPVPHDGAGAHPQHRPHLAGAPVRGRFGHGLRGQLHQPGHLHFHRRRAARQVALDPLKPALGVALAPARHLHAPDAKLFGNVFVLHAPRRQQHDACALRQPDAGALGARQPVQLAALRCASLNTIDGATLMD